MDKLRFDNIVVRHGNENITELMLKIETAITTARSAMEELAEEMRSEGTIIKNKNFCPDAPGMEGVHEVEDDIIDEYASYFADIENLFENNSVEIAMQKVNRKRLWRLSAANGKHSWQLCRKLHGCLLTLQEK